LGRFGRTAAEGVPMATDVRKGQWPGRLGRDEFGLRFRSRFYDPAFRAEDTSIDRLEAIAWLAYDEGRKAPVTRKAGPGYADPDYDLSVEWIEASERLKKAQATWADPSTPTRALVVCGSPRNDGTCPGEISKTFRLAGLVNESLRAEGVEVDFLDLSLITSDYGKQIHPCKGCVSTAEPLCHWPCSCYPNHALGQVDDWMNEIFERWVAAHAIVIVTPTHWYSTSSVLKLMVDRLVCADGGNPDPTATGGKDPAKAKALEMKGWNYPKHLDRRVYGLVVHGDVAGIEGSRRALSDWLDWMGLIDAGTQARLDRFIGYYEPYATSHEALDRDEAVQAETRVVARAVAQVTGAVRRGELEVATRTLPRPRPK
jgi:multimeric flavodoxin WrbA